MSRRKRASTARIRVGRVSASEHHGAWRIYYQQLGKQIRRKVGAASLEAEQTTAEVNAQLPVHGVMILDPG